MQMTVDQRRRCEPSLGVQRTIGVDAQIRADACEPTVLDGEIDEAVASGKARVCLLNI
jgi:hypothetical protein